MAFYKHFHHFLENNEDSYDVSSVSAERNISSAFNQSDVRC